MLILRRQGEVLLEKRPAPGVWGGLWCFPEVDAQRIAQECIGRYGVEATAITQLAQIEHGFTHFRLRITPVVVTVLPRAGVEEPGRVWLTPEDALGAAIPVPVKKILTRCRRTAGWSRTNPDRDETGRDGPARVLHPFRDST